MCEKLFLARQTSFQDGLGYTTKLALQVKGGKPSTYRCLRTHYSPSQETQSTTINTYIDQR